MNILSWILFGLIVGTVVHAIDPSPKRGTIVKSMFLGIVGALAGGIIANALIGATVTGFNTASFFIAIAGSLLLLFLGKAIRRT